MAWWNMKRSREDTKTEYDSKVEVVAHKKATREQIEAVNRANESLQKVFEKNGFTIKIYLAAGGRHAKTQKGKGNG